MIVNRHSSPAAKVALFRSLFRGREDVYARRFESRKTGRSGYQPFTPRGIRHPARKVLTGRGAHRRHSCGAACKV